MMYSLIDTVLGNVPVGFEWLRYLFGGVFFIMLLRLFFSALFMSIRGLGH